MKKRMQFSSYVNFQINRYHVQLYANIKVRDIYVCISKLCCYVSLIT